MSAFLITSWTCVMTFGGGLMALRLHAYRPFVLAFAAGALVSSALLDVIPDALELLARSDATLHHHHLMFMVCLGFLTFYLLEQGGHNGADPHSLEAAPAAGLLGAMGIGIHSLLDGVAIGEAFHAGTHVGWVVALAVVVHKFADGVSAVGILMSTRQSPRVTNVILGVIALAPLLGLALQAFIPLPQYMLAFVLGWFAGVFLYLGAAALIPAAHSASHSRWLPAATLAGVGLVYIVFRATT